MARRLQVTGFARFLVLMVVLAPLAYIGASYYNGEDGIANFKKLIGIGQSKDNTKDTSSDSDVVQIDDTDKQKMDERTLKLIKTYEAENESLRKQLDEKEQEIRQLKVQLDRLKN